MLGLPAPDIDYQAELDASGNLKGFQQQEWSLVFESFDTVGGFIVPRKMSIQRDDVRLKLIADDWVFKN